MFRRTTGRQPPSEVHIESEVDFEAEVSPKEQTLTDVILFAWAYVVSSSKRSGKSYLAGVLTVVIAVVSLLVSLTLKDTVRLLFLRVAELSVGENDLVLRPVGTDALLDSRYINRTLTQDVAEVVAPRWAVPATARDRAETVSSDILFVLLNSETERGRVGRKFLPRVLNEQEAYVSKGVAQQVGCRGNAGDRMYVDFDISQLLSALGSNFTGNLTGNGTVSLNDLGIDLTTEDAVALAGFASVAELLDSLVQQDIINQTTADSIRDISGLDLDANLTDLDITLLNVGLPQVLRLEVIVLEDVQDALGKWQDILGEVVVMDSEYLLKLIRNIAWNSPAIGAFSQQVLRAVSDQGELQDIEETAFITIIQLAGRLAAYKNPVEPMRHAIAKLTDDVFRQLGPTFLSDNMAPIAMYLETIVFLQELFTQIVILTIVAIFLLSAFVVFSLMIDNVSSRTFDFGMLRALGLRQHSLKGVMLLQGSTYAGLGTAVGLILGLIFVTPLSDYMSNSLGLSLYDTWVTTEALAVAAIAGIALPLFSSYYPVRHVFASKLRDALNASVQKVPTRVRSTRLKDIGLDPVSVVLSCSAIMVGFMCYFLLFYAILNQYHTLYFGILTFIMLLMVLGVSGMLLSLQPHLEHAVSFLIIRGEDRVMRPMVRKNLESHRSRSFKTSSLVSTSLGLIIFTAINLLTQFNMIVSFTSLAIGTDIKVTAMRLDVSLDREQVRDIMEPLKTSGQVADYAFATFNMIDTDTIKRATQSNLAYFPDNRADIIGVDGNLQNVLDNKFFRLDRKRGDVDYDSSQGNVDVVGSLYSAPSTSLDGWQGQVVVSGPWVPLDGMDSSDTGLSNPKWISKDEVARITAEDNSAIIDAVMSANIRPKLSLGVTKPMSVWLRSRGNLAATSITMVQPRAFLSLFPGFFFSDSPAFALFSSPMLVTFDSYKYLLSDHQDVLRARYPEAFEAGDLVRDEEMRIKDMFVRMKPGASLFETTEVVNRIKAALANPSIRILNRPAIMRLVDSVRPLATIVMSTALAVVIMICFISFFLSVFGNMKDNAWEQGVLRSLGVRLDQLSRMYLYESFCIILAAIFNGTLVGCIMGAILCEFTTVWTNLNFEMIFPVGVYFALVGIILLGTYLATWIPARGLGKSQIAQVLRGGL